MTADKGPASVEQLAVRLAELSRRTPTTELVAPIDLDGQRDRFLSAWARGERANPTFTYAPAEIPTLGDLAALRDEAAAVDSPWHRLIADEAGHEIDKAEAYVSRDPQQLTSLMVDVNGVPSAELLATAHRVLAAEPPGSAEPPTIGAEHVASTMRAVLQETGLSDWSVLVVPMAARMSVRGSHREVRVREAATFTPAELVRLAVHEIGTHVFRAANAANGATLLRRPVKGSALTEEGLASWHESTLGVSDFWVTRRHAARAVAADTALRGSFVDVVAALEPYVDLAEAFDIAVRAKRGLVDTGAPGGFIKDHVYLAGHERVSTYLSSHPSDYDLLMSTKWPLERLDLVRLAAAEGQTGMPVRVPTASLVELVRSMAVA